jgi:uncharacterized membrane protein
MIVRSEVLAYLVERDEQTAQVQRRRDFRQKLAKWVGVAGIIVGIAGVIAGIILALWRDTDSAAAAVLGVWTKGNPAE